MLTRVLLTMLVATTAVSAQGGGGAASGSGAPPMGGPATPFEDLVERLNLDDKKQLPGVQQIFNDAARDAAPVAQEMTQLRQKLINLELAKADDTKPVLDAYTAAAARMAWIETRAFQKVYAELKPNQQSKAGEAFRLMAGIFQPPPPRAPRTGRGGGGQ